jgi:ATP-dependent Clp protease protease subunit
VLFLLPLKGGGKVTKKVTAKKKFWAFKALPNKEGELTIYGEIADSQGGWFSDGNEVTPTSFKAELDALGDITTLNVYINSPGGDVFAGQTIYSQLRRHKAIVNMHVDGLAASIASVIVMAGDTIHIPVNGIVMIHHPMSGVYGNATEMRAMADTLDKVCESIQETYLAKAPNLKREDLVALLDAETWLTAQECFDLGLCDVVGDEKSIAASVRDFEILAKYRNTPRFIKVRDEDPPEPTEPIDHEEPNNPEEIAKAKAILALECEL